MRLKWGHLCDYATGSNNGKLVIVGVFDSFFHFAVGGAQFADDDRIPLSPFSLALSVGASSSEAGNHQITVRLLDADAEELLAVNFDGVPFLLSTPGHELQWQLAHQFQNVALPAGEYTFEVRADGHRLGDVPFRIELRTAAPA